jgi:hypothetical protein
MKEVTDHDKKKKQRYWLYIQGNPNIELEKQYKIVQHTRLIA